MLSGCSEAVGEEETGKETRKTGARAAGLGPALGFRLIHQHLQGKETLESSSSGSHHRREMLISERVEREREGEGEALFPLQRAPFLSRDL